MKIFKLLICFTILIGVGAHNITAVNALDDQYIQNNQVELFPETIEINGEVKNVKVVNLEEYLEDTSGDFLVLINNASSVSEEQFRSMSVPTDDFASTFSVGKKVAAYIGEKLVGYFIEKGIEYLVTSGVGAQIVAGFAKFVYAAFPYAMLITIGAAMVFGVLVALQAGQTGYRVSRVTNSSGCFYTGTTAYNGTWSCYTR